MIKIFISLILATIISVIGSGTLSASPMLFTFEGRVKQLQDGAGYASDIGIAMDSFVRYTFLFDFSRQGNRTSFDGVVTVFDDVGPIINGYEGSFDYFFAEYVSGSAFAVKFTDRPYSEKDYKQHNWGVIEDWSNTNVYSDGVYINTGWWDEQLTLSIIQKDINDPPIDLSTCFSIGSVWELSNQIDKTGDLWESFSLVRANVTLVSIQPVMVITCSGFSPPMENYPVKVKKNRVLPIKAKLFDTEGLAITPDNISTPPVIQIMYKSSETDSAEDVSSDALSPGTATPGNQFQFMDDHWQFNLKTTNYSAPGYYEITIVSGDPFEYQISSSCISGFVIE
jgi:hypothetical protein